MHDIARTIGSKVGFIPRLVNRLRKKVASLVPEQSRRKGSAYCWGFIETVRGMLPGSVTGYRFNTPKIRIKRRE
jgi:hypothetical protein